jgi:virginiamycin B lyase
MREIPGGYLRITDTNWQPILNYLSRYFHSESKLPESFGKAVRRPSDQEVPSGHELIFTEYEIPTPLAFPHTAVPDDRGSVWFTEFGAQKIGRLDIATGTIAEYVPTTPDIYPHGITASAEGIVWYTAFPYGIGKLSPGTGTTEEFKVPAGESGDAAGAHSIIVGRDGKIWFTEIQNGSIGSFDPNNGIFERFLIEPGSAPYGIIEREEQVFWFCLLRGSKIGFLNAKTGEVKTFATPTKDSEPQRLRFDSLGRLWFGEYESGKLGMFDPKTEQITEYDLPFRGSAYSVHVDQDDHVWVASFERDSLIRFDPESHRMTEFRLPGVGAIVRDIWPDASGRMWFVQWGRNKVTSAEYLGKRQRH